MGGGGVPIISPDVAFVKLEQKFNAAMSRIAELSTTNEELEHVNIQLQEETETVGEWISNWEELNWREEDQEKY